MDTTGVSVEGFPGVGECRRGGRAPPTEDPLPGVEPDLNREYPLRLGSTDLPFTPRPEPIAPLRGMTTRRKEVSSTSLVWQEVSGPPRLVTSWVSTSPSSLTLIVPRVDDRLGGDR